MSDIWLTHMTPIWVVGCKPHEIPHVYHIVFLYRSYVVCTWSPIWANHMGSTWVPHDTHMWFTTVKPIWANHMYATWVTYGSSMWHPYGWSGANHMKFHTFTILSSYIDPIWTPYTTLVVRCLLYTVLFLAWQQHCTCTLQASFVQIKSNQIHLFQTTTCSTFLNFMLQGKANENFLALTPLYSKANLPRWLCCLLCPGLEKSRFCYRFLGFYVLGFSVKRSDTKLRSKKNILYTILSVTSLSINYN